MRMVCLLCSKVFDHKAGWREATKEELDDAIKGYYQFDKCPSCIGESLLKLLDKKKEKHENH